MILAVTGHRPDKLGGWKIPNPTYQKVLEGLDQALLTIKPTMVITGMSLGVDQWVAELCIFNDIPFIAAVPCEGQANIWPEYARNRYEELLTYAHEIVIVSPGEYKAEKMHIRNKWMIMQSDLLLAVWNGSYGGTGKCVEKAQKMGRKVVFLNLPQNIPAPPPKIKAASNFIEAPAYPPGTSDLFQATPLSAEEIEAFQKIAPVQNEFKKVEDWNKTYEGMKAKVEQEKLEAKKAAFQNASTKPKLVPVKAAQSEPLEKERPEEKKNPYNRFVDLSD